MKTFKIYLTRAGNKLVKQGKAPEELKKVLSNGTTTAK